MQAAFPLGFAVGAGLLMLFAKKMKRRGLWMLTGITLTGVVMLVLSQVSSVTVALPLLFLGGLVSSICNVLFGVMLQSEVPTEVQGRVFGTLGSLTSLASPLAYLTSGLLADRMDPVMLATVAAACSVLVGLVLGAASPAMRRHN